MNPSEVLMLIVEASLALAGFAGVVTALGRRGTGHLISPRNLNLVNLLATSFGALFLSLGALALQSADVADATTWRACSAIGLVTLVFFSARSLREITRSIGMRRAVRSIVLYAINLPIVVVCALLVWNILLAAVFWPFFVMLVVMFAIGCFSFARLLLFPSSEESAV